MLWDDKPSVNILLTILCLCPPLSLDPLLPTDVLSPAGIFSRSRSSAHALTTVRYQSGSKEDGSSPAMLFRIDVLDSQGVSSQNAKSGYLMKSSPSNTGVSPARPLRKVDLPQPTGPTRMMTVPVGEDSKLSVIPGVFLGEEGFQPN